MSENKGILSGVRIVEMARFISAPFGTMLLADMGAEVIKVEKKGRGDDARGLGPYKDGESLYFPTFNRNKKSLELDFRNPDDIAILEKLLKTADVFVENFRPGITTKMGLSPQHLQELNPELIIVDVSGFGQSGPYFDRSGFDWIAQAMGGFMNATGTEESGPLVVGHPIVDELTGLYAAFGITAALFQRTKTGKGQVIDVSMLDCVVSMLQMDVPDYDLNGKIAKLKGVCDPVVAPAKRFKALDGYVYIHAGMDNHFKLLAEYLQNPVLLQEKYQGLEGRFPERTIVEDEIEKWTVTQTCDEIDKKMYDLGIPCGIVNDIARICSDPHLAYRKSLVKVEVDKIGEALFPGTALKMSEAGEIAYNRPPRLGEHNEEILKELENME